MFWKRKQKPEDVFERFSRVYSAAARPRAEPPKRPLAASPAAAPPDPLDVLGLADGASPDEIGAAYRQLARAHHPDKVANGPREVREESERRMKEINAAYSLLRHAFGERPRRGSKTG
jgi:DnaJ-domain-containing protein 1